MLDVHKISENSRPRGHPMKPEKKKEKMSSPSRRRRGTPCHSMWGWPLAEMILKGLDKFCGGQSRAIRCDGCVDLHVYGCYTVSEYLRWGLPSLARTPRCVASWERRTCWTRRAPGLTSGHMECFIMAVWDGYGQTHQAMLS